MKIKELAKKLTELIPNEKAQKFFEPCFLSTWETTTEKIEDDKYFVITGDIPALWLRDSSAQVQHLLAFAPYSDEVKELIKGLSKTQVECILIDPYANAFNKTDSGAGHHTDITEMHPRLWERKYEIDSLCYPIRLAYQYWKITDDSSIFTPDFNVAINKIIDLWTVEQKHENSPYTFERVDRIEEAGVLPNNGKGNPVAYTGMTWSGFRPSDDMCVYGYLVPSNMFAKVSLEQIAEIAELVYEEIELKERALKLKNEIEKGLADFAVVDYKDFGSIYAYEVDGMSNHLFLDDANVPSLLSLPYLGAVEADDPIYLNTRKFILSPENRTYYSGKYAAGVGSDHTPEDYVWHIALSMQGLTSVDENERKEILETLMNTDAGTYQMHEGFNVNNPEEFTRPWFAWSNSLFAEYLIDYFDLVEKLEKNLNA